MRSCANCDNYERRDGTCRGDLPRFIKRVENNYPDNGGAPGRWPTVKETEWCAHHVPIPPATGVQVMSVTVVD